MDSGSDLQSECDLPRRAVTEPASEIEYTIHLPRVRAVTVPTDGASGATAPPRPVSSISLVDSERDLPLRAVTEPVEHVSLFFTAGGAGCVPPLHLGLGGSDPSSFRLSHPLIGPPLRSLSWTPPPCCPC